MLQNLAHSLLVVVLLCSAGQSGAPRAAFAGTRGATLVVTSTADAGPGTLRQAILDANAEYDLDTISFAIAGSGPHTIALASPLPDIVFPVVIDGTTQPGFEGRPLVALDGSGAGSNASGLTLRARSSTVRALVVSHFEKAGIWLEQRYSSGSGDVVEGCYLGTDASGSVAAPNGEGIHLRTAFGARIGGAAEGQGNVISGNASDGVYLDQIGNATVLGNRIGVSASGDGAVGNGSAGIRVVQGFRVTIGGTDAGAGNLIAHNGRPGVYADFNLDVSIVSNTIFDNEPGEGYYGGGIGIRGFSVIEPPTVSSVVVSGATTTVSGVDRSGWLAGGPARVQIFRNGSCDANGAGEGETLVASFERDPDATGRVAFESTLPFALGPGEALTVTMTGPFGTTSPFSRCAQASGGCVLPFLTTEPDRVVGVRAGESVRLDAAASGSAPLRFQWYENSTSASTPIAGATSSSFTTPPLTQDTTFSVRVTNACGMNVGDNTYVHVCAAAPSLDVSGSETSIPAGRGARLVVDTPDGDAARYEWFEGMSGDTSTPADVGGGGAPGYSPPLYTPTDFWVRVTNACGTADSPTIHVDVISGPVVTKISIKNVHGSPALVAKGSGFTSAVYLVVDGDGFVTPAVGKPKKATQVGPRQDGTPIDELFPRGVAVRIYFVNDTGATTAVDFTRP